MVNETHSPGARDRLWPSRLLGKLANFNFTRIIHWTLVVNARVAVELSSGQFVVTCLKTFATLMWGLGVTLYH